MNYKSFLSLDFKCKKCGVLLQVFLSIGDNELKTYGSSAKKIGQLHENCILRFADDILKTKFIFEKNPMFYFFSDLRPVLFWIWMKSFR